MIRVKKAFTLIELILVVVLILVVYSLMISTSTFKLVDNKNKFSLSNINTFLTDGFIFNDEITLVCIDEKFDCFVRVDGKINEKYKKEKVFNVRPEVYEYNEKRKRIDFLPVRIKDMDHNVVFEFKINNDFKSKEYILDTLEGKVYVFNSIFKKAKVYESIDQAFEIFEKNRIEVKDAF